MGYMRIPYIWKQFFLHKGSSFSIQSQNGLIPGGKESDKRLQTIFFTPLNTFGGDFDDEEHIFDYTIFQKVQHHSHWKRNQDVVFWVKLFRAQDQGLQFFDKKSHAIVVYDLVPAECIYKSYLSERRSKTVRKTCNPTTRVKNHTEK